ncbi:FkbM family methyltransferase [Octadecabacter ascidiaceicola]|uniref:2-O-methyltransferase NoeI n=1 Tax=Octadecabacter ascidiaceicola TaxID=1655543 RepID=A0A238JK00_9RHOB|nr:FkbM family methyltransferase [Octadecabacter ascidiaceicola]SMX30991.1 2-O-methyltransferase NoeI [Octadecabacter ascidiaceicola]
MNRNRNARKRARLLASALGISERIQIADIGARKMKKPPVYQPLLGLDVAELIGFEPEPEAFAVLKANAEPNTRYIQSAVGKPGPATFYSHTIGSLSSVFKIAPKAAKYLGKMFWVRRPVEEFPIDLVSLDDLDDMPKLDILKMDIQGAELDVMKGGTKTLSDALVIIPEVRFYQMYEGEPSWAELDIEMRKQGFVLHSFQHQKRVPLPNSQRKKLSKKARTQLLDGDAAYIRSLENPSDLTDLQLQKFALAADVVLSAPDLCLFCLDILVERGLLPKTITASYLNALDAEMRIDVDVDD